MSTYQIRTHWTGPFGSTDSVMHVDNLSGTAQQAATAVMNLWQTIDNTLHSSCSWSIDTDVRHFNPATGALLEIDAVSAASGTGSGTGDYVDLLQGLIVWNTGEVVDGRLLRGRTFIPGITEASVDTNGRPTSGFRTVVDGACATYIADATSLPVVWHRPIYSGSGAGRVLVREGSYQPITSGAAKTRWSYMSGRRLTA